MRYPVLPEISFTGVPLASAVEALLATVNSLEGASSRARMNIVLVDGAAGSRPVTVSLQNQSLDRVLEFLAETADLKLSVEGNTAVLRSKDSLPPLATDYFPMRRSEVIEFLAASVGSGEGEPEAVRIREFFQNAGIDFEGIPGAGIAYDGTGIIVTQTREALGRIGSIVARYAATRQVEIEARFMEVQEGTLEELGIAWEAARRGLVERDPTTLEPILDRFGRPMRVPQESYGTSGVTRTLAEAFNGAQSLNSILIDGEAVASTQPSQLPGSAQLGANASRIADLSGWIGDFDVSAVVRALSQEQGAELLSAPRLTVISGRPARITVAQEMRYPQSYGQIQSQVGSTGSGSTTGGGSAGVTITAGTPQDFATRNIGVELQVTAHIEKDRDLISLNLEPKVTDFDGFMEYGGPSLAISAGTSVTVPPGFYQPIFSVREVSTEVTVRSGETIVMGGLTREEKRNVNDRVPFLGDIPLLGRLFRTKGESSQKRTLLIFVTARLVSTGGEGS